MSQPEGQARDVQIYRLMPLMRKSRSLDALMVGGVRVITGELADHIVVSVPPDTSMASAAQIADTLEQSVGKKVLVVGHNTEFLTTEKVSEAQRQDILGRIQKPAS